MTRYHALQLRARRRIVLGALLLTRGNVTHAARRLGISRVYVHRLLRTLDVERDAFWGRR